MKKLAFSYDLFQVIDPVLCIGSNCMQEPFCGGKHFLPVAIIAHGDRKLPQGFTHKPTSHMCRSCIRDRLPCLLSDMHWISRIEEYLDITVFR